MKIRLEVGRAQRASFDWFVRAARKHPSFRLENDGAVEVAILELGDTREFVTFFQFVAQKAKVAVYLDDTLLDFDDVWRMIWRSKGLDDKGMPRDLGAADDKSLTGRMLRDLDREPGDPEA